MSYSLSEVRDGTGWPEGVRFHVNPTRVWVLAVDNPGSRSLHTSVHLSEQEALDALRSNYGTSWTEEEAETIPDSELIDFVVSQGCEIALDEHILPT